MDDLDPQVIAAVERAAREASDPQLRDRLSAAAAIFAALARRDKREREAWAIVRDVATGSVAYRVAESSWWRCPLCGVRWNSQPSQDRNYLRHESTCLVIRARALLSEEGREDERRDEMDNVPAS